MKPAKGIKQVKTPRSKIGMGDFYGSGVRNPIGKQRDTYGPDGIPRIKPKKPPRSLA